MKYGNKCIQNYQGLIKAFQEQGIFPQSAEHIGHKPISHFNLKSKVNFVGCSNWRECVYKLEMSLPHHFV